MVRTGKAYVDGLREEREVYVDGTLVRDVVDHPAFRRPIESYAAQYDLKHRPDLVDLLTFEHGDGQVADTSFMVPRSRHDLTKRGRALRTYSTAHYGFLGRPPCVLASMLTAVRENAAWFGQWGGEYEANVAAYYEHVRDNDLFLTHALGSPQTDRSRPSHLQADPGLHLHATKETDAGLVVSGAKQLATAAPLADEVWVFPNTRGFVPGEEPYCLAFAVSTSTPGLKILCREPLVPGADRRLFDHPFSSRFEEIDALLVFDDVLVPWERVFFYNNLEAANTLRSMLPAGALFAQPSVITGAVRTGMAVALLTRLTESVQTISFPNVAEQIGRVIAMQQAIEGLLVLADDQASVTPNGTWVPKAAPLQAFNILFPQIVEEIQHIMRRLSGAGVMLTPSLADFAGPGGELEERFFVGAGVPGSERVQIAKAAWDYAGDSFAQRTLQYDQFHAGEPMFFAANYARHVDISVWRELLQEILDAGAAELAQAKLAAGV
ncbi:MAG TPA: 4-hydroxyphenylacetate 3-hydroxylase N-terminal domain-containing protein [Acidimicrobiales bacterium]|nr:4-hydroxyphenylacetate 3-hydroxylase N-terminal domain-containing protein [Acidimicrobiales bacterium]